MADIKKVSIGGTQYDIRDANAIEKGYAVNDFATNCITEIPQDINLTLSSGTLTLKSGSVVTFADGTQYQTTVDRATSWYTSSVTNGQVYFVADTDGRLSWTRYPAVSSSTEPTKQGGALWYDTTNNVIKRCDGSVWLERSFPVCICTVTNSVITSIDKVFNGAGYIGYHAFVLPGVKALIPDGKNDDGTLKSILWNENRLLIRALEKNATNYALCLQATSPYMNYSNRIYWQYSKEQNLFIHGTNSIKFVELVSYAVASYSVTQFDIRQVSGLSHNYIQNALTGVSGYASNKTQTLKHVNGVLTFVDG